MRSNVRTLALAFGLAAPTILGGAAPAIAEPGEPLDAGARVVQCRDLNAPAGELIGNIVFTPSGHEGQHCRPSGDAGAGGGGGGGAIVLSCSDVVAGLEGNIVFTPSNNGNYHCSPFNP